MGSVVDPDPAKNERAEKITANFRPVNFGMSVLQDCSIKQKMADSWSILVDPEYIIPDPQHW